MSTLAERYKLILEKTGLGPHQLSLKAGLSGGTIGNAIKRNSNRTDANTIRAIAEIAGVSERWLATGDGPMDREADEPSGDSGIDEGPRHKEAPSTFGEYDSYARVERDARAIAPEVPEWAWQATRSAHPMWIGKDDPTAAVIADVARVIMKHRPR